MKHLFNDISKDEKNRILEMHKTATDKHYLTENYNINDIMNNIRSEINKDGPKEIEAKMRAAWRRCKTQHKYVGLSVFQEDEILRILFYLLICARTEKYIKDETEAGNPPSPEMLRKFNEQRARGLNDYADRLKEYSETQENIKELEPDFKQELEWFYECIKNDAVLMGLVGG